MSRHTSADATPAASPGSSPASPHTIGASPPASVVLATKTTLTARRQRDGLKATMTARMLNTPKTSCRVVCTNWPVVCDSEYCEIAPAIPV